MEIAEIESYVSKIPDYPKPGILFYDISSLLIEKKAFYNSIELLIDLVKKYQFELIAGIDARGFIFASAIAHSMKKGFVMIRKKNKLPGKKISYEYNLEYGSDKLELNVDLSNKKLILVDDLLATGGTANAATKLIKKSGGEVCCFVSLIELDFLEGRKKIEIPTESLIHY